MLTVAVPVSKVVTAFNQLPKKFAEMTDTLNSAEITYFAGSGIFTIQVDIR